jgi:tryptophan synthase alpha chain
MTQATRLREAIDRQTGAGAKAMGLFVTNGFPEPAATLPIMHALEEGGATFIELGMPFSDPLAEGAPIQRSSARALAHGVRMADTFRTVEAFRMSSELPVLLMGYINPVFRYGVEAFCRDAVAAGVDGLILPDLPFEEHDLVLGPAAAAGLSTISLIAPTTPDDRMKRIDEITTGFVYAVSIAGLTGASLEDTSNVEYYLARARRAISNPLMVGFGIRSPETARRLTRHTDGFIVGSALIEAIERLWDDGQEDEAARLRELTAFVRHLASEDPVEAP